VRRDIAQRHRSILTKHAGPGHRNQISVLGPSVQCVCDQQAVIRTSARSLVETTTGPSSLARLTSCSPLHIMTIRIFSIQEYKPDGWFAPSYEMGDNPAPYVH
jgi:hypothetical protein